MLLCLAILDLDPLPQDWMTAWSFPVAPFIVLSMILAIYLLGWRAAFRTRSYELPLWRGACFVAGIISLWIAIASPIDALDDYLLAAHMLQHFILMSVAPPLIVLGAPTVPLLRGLPRWLIRALSRPVFRAPWFHKLCRLITHPVFAWLAMNIAYLGWHVPAMFELTFLSENIHNFEHVCFFLTSTAFWWVVIAALANTFALAALDDHPLPADCRCPQYSPLRHAGLLRKSLVLVIRRGAEDLQPYSATGPGCRGRGDVGVEFCHLPRAGSCHHHAIAFPSRARYGDRKEFVYVRVKSLCIVPQARWQHGESQVKRSFTFASGVASFRESHPTAL